MKEHQCGSESCSILPKAAMRRLTAAMAKGKHPCRIPLARTFASVPRLGNERL
jgi:hypothetical protein